MTEQAADTKPAFWPEEDGVRRPRIALMGEFSAGKSTLANLMVGSGALPVQVVATQLPPVWISYGDAPSVMVGLDGRETPCDVSQLESINKEETAFIRIYSQSDILQRCDLIDMPGISDPNMPSVVWERVLPIADGVLWCTPATQAWRQSEAATWDGIDDKIRQNSLLVITRSDMLLTDRDRTKVQKRVRNETAELFSDHVMMSLHLAHDAEVDSPQWAESGIDTFVETFLSLIDRIGGDLPGQEAIVPQVVQQQVSQPSVTEEQIVPRRPGTRRSRLIKNVQQNERPAPETVSYMPKFS